MESKLGVMHIENAQCKFAINKLIQTLLHCPQRLFYFCRKKDTDFAGAWTVAFISNICFASLSFPWIVASRHLQIEINSKLFLYGKAPVSSHAWTERFINYFKSNLQILSYRGRGYIPLFRITFRYIYSFKIPLQLNWIFKIFPPNKRNWTKTY